MEVGRAGGPWKRRRREGGNGLPTQPVVGCTNKAPVTARHRPHLLLFILSSLQPRPNTSCCRSFHSFDHLPPFVHSCADCRRKRSPFFASNGRAPWSWL